jgi:hypothetical protein
MKYVLFLLSGLAFFAGICAFGTAQSIFQEIAGLVAFVIWAILFSSASIIDSILNLKSEIKGLRQSHNLGSGQM